MFSFAPQWLWANCLAIAAGFLLLGYVHNPGADSLYAVSGKVSDLHTKSVKGFGSYYDLSLDSAGGVSQTVSIPFAATDEASVKKLIGRRISAKVNSSSEAIELGPEAGSLADDLDAAVKRSDLQNKLFVGFFAVLGVVLGLVTLLWRQRDET